MRSADNLRSSAWLAIVLAAVPAAVSAQDSKKPAAKVDIVRGISETVISRETFTGNEARIAAMNYVHADCTSGPLPLLRVVTAPQYGELRQEEITIPLDRNDGDRRAICNGKPVNAVGVFYKSKAGYTGKDNIVIDVDFKAGTVRRYSYKITVR